MGESDIELASIVERARQGDETACRALMEQLYSTVIKIVRSHLPVRTAEEDLMQEVFLKMFSKLPDYQARPGIPITHWVSRIAVTVCLDALRSERRRPEIRHADLSEEQTAWLEYLATDVQETPRGDQNDAREILQSLLGQLSVEDRMILNLLHLEERSVRDVSQITGWSRPSVKVRAFRARRRLRSLVEEMYAATRYEEI